MELFAYYLEIPVPHLVPYKKVDEYQIMVADLFPKTYVDVGIFVF